MSVTITETNSTGTTVYVLGTTPSTALAKVATTGSYNDLISKPTIPAAQKNANWNSTAGVTAILNKPNLSTVATSGNYNDLTNKPSIPVYPTLATVATSGNYNDLNNKPTIPTLSTINRKNGSVALALVDARNQVDINSTTASTVTIPINTKVNFDMHTEMVISQYGTGEVTIVGESGVTLRSSGGKNKLFDRYSHATIKKIGDNEWYLVGNLK